jgi:hypothetical protein
MEDKSNISTNYVELHTSNKIHVSIIPTSAQDILMKMVVVVIMIIIITTVTICNIWYSQLQTIVFVKRFHCPGYVYANTNNHPPMGCIITRSL